VDATEREERLRWIRARRAELQAERRRLDRQTAEATRAYDRAMGRLEGRRALAEELGLTSPRARRWWSWGGG
jgi:hypothetical protein